MLVAFPIILNLTLNQGLELLRFLDTRRTKPRLDKDITKQQATDILKDLPEHNDLLKSASGDIDEEMRAKIMINDREMSAYSKRRHEEMREYEEAIDDSIKSMARRCVYPGTNTHTEVIKLLTRYDTIYGPIDGPDYVMTKIIICILQRENLCDEEYECESAEKIKHYYASYPDSCHSLGAYSMILERYYDWFYSNGKPKVKCTYKDGKKIKQYFWVNGNIRAEYTCNYEDGVKELQKNFDRDGNLIGTTICKNGTENQ